MEIKILNQEEMMYHDQCLIMLGCFETKLVGYIGIIDFKEIKYLYVEEDYRNQGIGTRLLNQALLLMKGKVCASIPNTSREFFIKNHFVQVDQHEKKATFEYQCHDEKQFTSYDQVHEFIASQKDRVYALDNFQRFMNDLCEPQRLLKTIHIGGTNGKGSSTNYIRSVLQTAGYKVATFTSPVLETRLEIMRINNQHIQEQEIISYANRYMSLWLEYELSMFEIEVFIAIMYFASHHVDFAIFEVGLGGELDATNIIYPLISGITNIGLDHIEYLGNTYQEIAKTKGGIIKNYTPFVTGETKEECLNVFQQLCHNHASQFIQLQPIENIQETLEGFSYHYRHYHIQLHTKATYQIQNSAFALEILHYLNTHQIIHITNQNIEDGIYNAVWRGRFEIVNKKPLMIMDGAHNKEGIEAFCNAAKHYQNIKIIFSALRDKDTHAMIEKLLTLTNDITICEFDFYRAQSAEKLAEDFPVHIEKDWKKAIDESFYHQGVVFVTGSLYFISQVRPYILSKSS